MPARPVLNRLQQQILEILARCQFATHAQLAHYAGARKSYLSQMLGALTERGYVASQIHAAPHIFYLTHRGAATLATGRPAGGRPASWSVMAQACHRNAFEIAMRATTPRFRFLARQTLLQQGLNPSHGDHAARIDDTPTTWYVLIDDYQLPPQTLAHRWTRAHRASRQQVAPGPRRRWCDVANRFMVVCTDPVHAERHRALIARDGLPAAVLDLKGLWKGFSS